VVKEAVSAWEREEESIDDITCIIVFFRRSHEPTVESTDNNTPMIHEKSQAIG
jgi:hypothetical protein